MTTLLQSKDIKRCIQLNEELIPIIEDAFKNLALGKTVMPPILRLDIKKYQGESDVKAAYIEGLDSFAIKVASGFFNNPSLGLPSSNGLMILLDSKTGILKSILLDKGYLTDVRTAIAGAIASKYLSNPEAASVGIVGAGIQAKLQLQALLLVRKPSEANVWGRNPIKVKKFIEDMKKITKINFFQCSSPEELTVKSEIIVTATPSDTPLIKSEWLKKGKHITAMGSDAGYKNEVDPLIIRDCDLYVPDNQMQTSILGELHHAIKGKLINTSIKFTELGEIILDPSLGRKSKNDITVCDLTGTGVQDTAIARHTFNLAKEKNLGKQLD